MANYLYNGVELPDINEVWTDKESYPYAVIWKKSTSVTVDPVRYGLVVSSEPIYWVDGSSVDTLGVITAANTITFEANIYADSPNDAEWAESSRGESYVGSINEGYDALWANHDVFVCTYSSLLDKYTVTDTIHMAASEPVPVSTPTFTLDLKSWLIGFALGLCGKPLPFAKKTPIGYSYNGVVLPALPEWDREGYPYAVIMDLKSATNATSDFIVWFLDNPIVFRGSYLSYANGINDGYAQNYIYNNGDSGWVLNEEKTDFWDDLSLSGDLVWTNTDILSEADGTVYLATSEPVPVYE